MLTQTTKATAERRTSVSRPMRSYIVSPRTVLAWRALGATNNKMT